MKLIILSIIGIILQGCWRVTTDINGPTTVVYKYVNNSGTEVALVGEVNENFNIPDSLVLHDNATIQCQVTEQETSSDRYRRFPYKGHYDKNIPIKIYFNKNLYKTYYIDNPSSDNDNKRNPLLCSDGYPPYIMTENEKNGKKGTTITTITYTYIFTEEDYQNSITTEKRD